jgi:hypothetical protein
LKAVCTAEISQYIRKNLSPDDEVALREILKLREILIRTGGREGGGPAGAEEASGSNRASRRQSGGPA